MTDDTPLSQAQGRLSRDMLADGTVYKLATQRDGENSTVLSFEQLQASRRAFLPDDYHGPDIWIFGYGSLIWNPLISFQERCYGRLYGFHRRFCLWTRIGRGSPESPGLVLALDRGGSVRGCVYRISADAAVEELDMLWRREMLNGSYCPRWLTVYTQDGPVRALAFTIRQSSHSFAPKMPVEQTCQIIARAEGFIGPCRDYLFETAQALENEGMADPVLARLVVRVREICGL